MAVNHTHTAKDHEKDGLLEINVGGLQGVLASEQYPKPHDHLSSAYGHGGRIKLSDLLDVDLTGIEDGYVLYFDLVSNTFRFKEVTGGGGLILAVDGGSASSIYGMNDHLDGGPAIDTQDSTIDGGSA